MASLLQMCELPQEWLAQSAMREQRQEVGMSKKLAWKTAKRVEHERLLAYRERERKRGGMAGEGLGRSRQRVQRETMAEPMGLERGGEMFYLGQGVRQPKKAKNRASKEAAGTIGRTIVVKRFEGSRLTCVCKSLIY